MRIAEDWELSGGDDDDESNESKVGGKGREVRGGGRRQNLDG